jgi:hypothetical protein
MAAVFRRAAAFEYGQSTFEAGAELSSALRRWSALPVFPAAITLLAMGLLVAYVLASNGGDPLALARLGDRYLLSDPQGSEGYDGQFVYYIAMTPEPKQVAAQLDVPAYRYQRILLPLLARAFSLGKPEAIPWVLVLIGITSQAAGTWLVARLLGTWGVNPAYALGYGLWVGFGLAVRLDLPEPLAYALVAGALLAELRARNWLSWGLFALALFAKEVTLPFVAAAGLAAVMEKRWRDAAGLSLVAVLPYTIFQTWLWAVFGSPGIGSGGAMATAFEIIPFMGLWRIGMESLVYLAAILIVFGPSIVLPSLWGIGAALKKIKEKQINVVVLSLLLNSLLIVFLPFSTFRETGGLTRFACGLVLAVLLFAARYRVKRVLNYSPLWLVLNLFLFKTGNL